MGGKKKPVIGYHYRPAWHMGLCIGPLDAFLEFRAGDKTAWSGNLTASGSVDINQPNLFGGEKDQGGVVGTLALLNGEPTQQPDPYLIQTFGDQVPAWRGFATVAWRGGRYGAMNPYPQKAAYKVFVAKAHWDDPGCWYPEKAMIEMDTAGILPPGSSGWEYQQLPYQSDPGHTHLTPPSEGWQQGGVMPFNDTNGWTRDPDLSVFWVRKTIQLGGGGITIRAAADNGCVLWVNGQLIGVSNPNNEDVPSNQDYPVEFPVPGAGTYEIVVKAYTESTSAHQGGNYLSVTASGTPVLAMNPAHILYFARTQSMMGQRPRAFMDDANMRAAADWYYGQRFGLCPEYDASQESIDDFIARIGQTAGCALNLDHATGLYRIDIANGIYDLESLPIITDDDVIEWSMQPAILSNAVNSVSVEYTDPVQKTTVTTPPMEATALVDAFGRIHQDLTYDAIPTAGLAARVAQRELLNSVTPTHGFDLTCTPRVASGLLTNQYFRLQTPRHGVSDMVCVVGDVDTGTLKSGAVKMTSVENIYSLPTTAFAEVETGIDTRRPSTPVPVIHQRVVETPYVDIAGELPPQVLAALDVDAAFVEAIAVDPEDSRNFTLQAAPHGSGAFVDVADGEWCPSALIVEGDTLQDAAPTTDFTLADADRLAQVQAGSIALWDAELCRVDAIDVGAGTLTLGRGCGDTVAAPHAANSRIYLYGDTPAYDDTQYTAGESIDVRLLSTTGTAQLDPGLAGVVTVALIGRMVLPYPPGRLRIDGDPYPTAISGKFTATWAHRNRAIQADKIVDEAMGDVTPADNVRYRLTLKDDADNVLVMRDDIGPGTADVELVAGGNITLELSAIDPYGESMQKHVLTFAYAPAATPPGEPTITATAYTPVDDSTIIDGGDLDG